VKKTALILGAGGFVGQALVKFLSNNYQILAATKTGQSGVDGEVSLDITSEYQVTQFFSSHRPDIIINASGVSGFAKCENNPELAYQVNVDGVRNILGSTSDFSPLVIQLSSNVVFGAGSGDYREKDVTSANTVYGKTRSEAEKVVREMTKNHIIIRTCDLYGDYQYSPNEKRFVHLVLDSLKNNKPFSVYSDILSTPTYLLDVVKGVRFLVDLNFRGIIHLAGPGSVSRMEYARLIARTFGFDDQLLKPTESTGAYHRFSTLNTEKILNLGFHSKSLKEGLSHFRDHGNIPSSSKR
jgi:dTDP-4-dehydrorhamnose reductase